MRIHDIISEAKTNPYIDPMKAGRNYEFTYSNTRVNKIEAALIENLVLDDGTIPAEVAEIKTPTGMYDPNKVTPEWVAKVAKAHPTDKNWKYLLARPGSIGGWLTGSDKADQNFVKGVIDTKVDRLQYAIGQYNLYYSPGGHYWSNRPYVQGIVPGYQADARTGKVETQSHDFDPVDIKFYLSAYKWCRDQGLIPVITPEQWIMLLLVEGSEEFGTRPEVERSLSPAMQKFNQMLQQKGLVNYRQREFCVTVMDKLTTAKRLGIPLYQAWNGSKIYLDRYNIQALAAKDPKNKQLVDLVNSILA
jgi:hypothetical protein